MKDIDELFGEAVKEHFKESCFEVKTIGYDDLAIKEQPEDLVILEKEEGDFIGTPPDGFDNQVDYSLIMFKSIDEKVDDWAIQQLISYYVHYRKLLVGEPKSFEPEERFRLYAVGMNYPGKLLNKGNLKQEKWKGVYSFDFIGFLTIKIIVLSEIEKKEHNALWLKFGEEPQKIRNNMANRQADEKS